MFRYNVKNDIKKIAKSRKNLKWIYDQMPETFGCLDNISKETGGCESWCCAEQFPSVWYVEFLYSWNYVVHNWNDQKILSLIEKSLRNYLFPKPERSCVFWDKDSKMCSQHNYRGYNCRIYGIEPEEDFNKRLVKLKVIYPNIKNQCNLVSTTNGEKVEEKDIKFWWDHLKNTEASIGVLYKDMHDGHGGSYRSYHDHILLHLFDDATMEFLSNTRTDGDPMQKETAIRRMLLGLQNFLNRKEI